jgi:hypothetical protein
MRIESLDVLFGRSLHNDLPATLEGFFQQRRQHAFELLALQVVEEYLGHRMPLRYFS